MNIQLSDHFDVRRLLRFTFPSIVMMVFTSIYSVVDGFFVSNFVGKTPFAAVNLIMPYLMLFSAIGFMIGTGGSALVSMTLGMGKHERANRLFSMFVAFTAAAGVLLALVSVAALRKVAALLGAQGDMLDQCVVYGRILMPALPFFMLQNTFQSFFVTAEKPKLGLAVSVAAGLTNIALDALFVAVFRWGLVGAAVATTLSQIVGGLIPLLYFALPNSSILRLTRFSFDARALVKACANGSSELMSNLSLSLVNMLYNWQLIRFAGEDGVAAYGVIMYVNMIFISAFLGYSIGSAPVISFHYGAQNHAELQNLFSKSLALIGAFGLAMTALAELFSGVLAGIFVSYDPELLAMTTRGFRLYSLAFLVMGFNIFASAFFTALGNGLVSATISFLRTLLFSCAAVIVLPMFLKLDGIWLSVVAAELLSVCVSAFFMARMRRVYHY